MTTERIPKVGDHIEDPHGLWIAELEDDFAKVRDEEGFTYRIRLDRLSWHEGKWAVIEDIEPDPETDEQPGREGWPEFNGAFR